MISDPASAPAAVDSMPVVPWERWAVRAVQALFVAVGINSIHNLAYMGQDYSLHVICTEHLMLNPGQWFTLPRLVLPALWGFALILFATAETVFKGHRSAPYVIAALVLFQAVVGVRSVWY